MTSGGRRLDSAGIGQHERWAVLLFDSCVMVGPLVAAASTVPRRLIEVRSVQPCGRKLAEYGISSPEAQAAVPDLLLGILFITAFVKTRTSERRDA